MALFKIFEQCTKRYARQVYDQGVSGTKKALFVQNCFELQTFQKILRFMAIKVLKQINVNLALTKFPERLYVPSPVPIHSFSFRYAI